MTPGRGLDRACGALLGTFVGDALGMPFERQSPDAVPERVEMVAARLGRGTYTDDTQMMIALAESLLDRGVVEAGHLGQAFLTEYDPRRGYGSGTRAVLALLADGVPVAEAATRAFDGGGSLGNGAAMRIAPIAVRYAHDRGALLDAARTSAHVTHAHPIGIDAAVVQATAIGAALRGEDPLAVARGAARTRELRDGLAQAARLVATCLPPKEVAASLGNGSTGHASVPTAIYAAVTNPGFEDAVTFAVRCGGDTDTIGAMAGAITGAREGASAIPQRWLDALEDGEKGYAYVARLAEQLVS